MRALIASVLMSVVALSPVCAMAKDILDPAAQAGLVKTEVSGFREAYIKPGVDFSRYSQVVIKPLGFGPGGDKRREDDVAKITAPNREELAERFGSTLKSHLGETRQVVEAAAGQPTLVVEPVLLAARSNRTPYDMRPPALINAKIYGIGSAKVTYKVSDAATGEVLLITADQREGEDLRNNFNAPFFWGDVNQFASRWASALAEALPAAKKPVGAS